VRPRCVGAEPASGVVSRYLNTAARSVNFQPSGAVGRHRADAPATMLPGPEPGLACERAVRESQSVPEIRPSIFPNGPGSPPACRDLPAQGRSRTKRLVPGRRAPQPGEVDHPHGVMRPSPSAQTLSE